MSEFRMPALGADMQFGTIVDWRVKPGDAVKRGDVVALVETEKGVIEVEIFDTGVIESLVVQPGQKVPVGATLAILRSDGKQIEPQPVASPSVSAAEPAVPIQEEKPPVKIPSAARPAEAAGRWRVSPLARKRAQELGVDLSRVAGSGGDDSITLADVERAVESPKPAVPPTAPPAASASKGLDLSAMRRVIAAALARSKREIPHFYLATTIDMRKALDWLAAENAKRPVTRRLLNSAL
ncbi:MAG: biotin/lipoyl-containing protein, partial [Candidatus Binatia bacterium]